MNRKFSSIHTANYITIFITLVILLMSVGDPLVWISRVITTQQALNQECKTNYNFIQVALSGDNLARLCQIKNQQITIK
jgi:sensor domain CHASE-containing protein